MDYFPVVSHPVALYQLMASPFYLLYRYLCANGHLSFTARFIYMLVGGLILAFASMGLYALFLFIPALFFPLLFHMVSWQQVHRWAFTLQMSWQTGCHLWVMYRQYYLQEAITMRLSITISSLMLLTQKVTSLALDIHERKVTVISLERGLKDGFHQPLAYNILTFLSYFMFFPALLGAPLCSFGKFKHQVHKSHMLPVFRPMCQLIKGCSITILLQMVCASISRNIQSSYALFDCSGMECVYIMWITAVIFKLTYYSHWILDESLFYAAGFETDNHHGADMHTGFSDFDIFALETTYKISFFARSWNKSTAIWLKRLIFKRCRIRPLLMTFAFSAWWHGLYPGQVFGFLTWAMMVQADYRIHEWFGEYKGREYMKYLYRIVTWIQTQLIIAFIIVAVEMRSFGMVLALCSTYNIVFPLLYFIVLLFLTKT
uniref:Membrane bound O-acyltransferase domain containing 4 n=1 Tax=Leptobrachium leishanense TaxID=445787 RepID=A0A8C5P6F1_9ANUR